MNHSVSTLHLHLTLEQSSLVLEALMEQPFKQVFEIIGVLNQQAQQFYQTPDGKDRAQLFVINKADFTVCIKSLGELPYNRVSNLILNLHQQLNAQFCSPESRDDNCVSANLKKNGTEKREITNKKTETANEKIAVTNEKIMGREIIDREITP